jgi:hypothetical protein
MAKKKKKKKNQHLPHSLWDSRTGNRINRINPIASFTGKESCKVGSVESTMYSPTGSRPSESQRAAAQHPAWHV